MHRRTARAIISQSLEECRDGSENWEQGFSKRGKKGPASMTILLRPDVSREFVIALFIEPKLYKPIPS